MPNGKQATRFPESGKRMKSAANYAMMTSVQYHHRLFIELKLCNVIICIAGKNCFLRGWEKTEERGPPLGSQL